jgi:hypothetical protein
MRRHDRYLRSVLHLFTTAVSQYLKFDTLVPYNELTKQYGHRTATQLHRQWPRCLEHRACSHRPLSIDCRTR